MGRRLVGRILYQEKRGRMKTLTVLANKYRSDKGTKGEGSHGYTKEYSKYFPKNIGSLLEIGVAKGASALMWKEYYPEAEIHLFDLFKDPEHVTMDWCRQNGFYPYQGDQNYVEDYDQIAQQFDVIVDDGSHRADHMLISFKHLFVNNLKPEGLYAIEDTHCNKDRFYDGGLVTQFSETPLGTFKRLLEGGYIENPYFEHVDYHHFEYFIKDIKILAKEKLILIWKR